MSEKSKKYIHPAKRDRIKNAKTLQKSRPLTTSNFHHLEKVILEKVFGPSSHNLCASWTSFPRSSGQEKINVD